MHPARPYLLHILPTAKCGSGWTTCHNSRKSSLAVSRPAPPKFVPMFFAVWPSRLISSSMKFAMALSCAKRLTRNHQLLVKMCNIKISRCSKPTLPSSPGITVGNFNLAPGPLPSLACLPSWLPHLHRPPPLCPILLTSMPLPVPSCQNCLTALERSLDPVQSSHVVIVVLPITSAKNVLIQHPMI